MDADDDAAFKALADPTRRRILDALRDRDGQSLSELESVVAAEADMTRFGVMKHVKVLVAAGLVTTERSGRQTLHHLNPVPIRLIHDRWISRYTESKVAALSDLKNRLESS
jgi:DNA-binding transcriptional ArsR family regulator